MMANFWVGNEDWAHKNYYASRHRVPGGRWRYHAWDSEHVIKGASQDSIIFMNRAAGTLRSGKAAL